MIVQEAIELFKKHQKGTVKKNTLKSCGKFLEHFQERFSACEVVSVSADEIGRFLKDCTEGLNRSTRHLRYAQIKAFFNYVIEATGVNIKNPCSVAVLSKVFKNVQHQPRKILDKETVDEIIFNSDSVRDRLVLELQARCGLRIREVLNLRASDISGRKIVIQDPKSGGTLKLPLCRNTSLSGLSSMGLQIKYPPRAGCSLSAIPPLGTWS